MTAHPYRCRRKTLLSLRLTVSVLPNEGAVNPDHGACSPILQALGASYGDPLADECFKLGELRQFLVSGPGSLKGKRRRRLR
jgi:hypothetical protein